MSDKLPWFPFYIDLWETDHHVRAMGPVARSYYLILLMVQWREGYIPDCRNTLRRLLTLPSDPLTSVRRFPADSGSADDFDLLDYDAILDQVLECFSPDGDGRLTNLKLKSIRDEQLRVLEAKSRGGKHSSRSPKRVSQESTKTAGVDLDLDLDLKKEGEERATASPPLSFTDLKPCEAARMYLEHEDISYPVTRFALSDVEAGIKAIQGERKLGTMAALEWLFGQARKAKMSNKKVGPDWVRKAGYNDLTPKKPPPMVNAYELKMAQMRAAEAGD